MKTAQRLLRDLARPRLRRSLATTNAAESVISRTRSVKRNVKRWRGGQMMPRWAAPGTSKR